MAAWLTVYCHRSVARLKAVDLLARLKGIEDVYTLAEGFGIDDEEAVDRAMSHLSVEPVAKQGDVKFRLCYRTAKLRPVFVHHWTARDRVRVLCEEALEQLDGVKVRNAGRVRSHLAECAEVVALELGWSQLEDMGVVLAGQLAEFFAAEGDGLIRDQNDDWWAMRNGIPMLLVGQRGGS